MALLALEMFVAAAPGLARAEPDGGRVAVASDAGVRGDAPIDALASHAAHPATGAIEAEATDAADATLQAGCLALLTRPFHDAGISLSSSIVDRLLAGVPDPVDSGLASSFDNTIEAIQLAIQKVGYLRDRSWLPWNDPSPEDRERSLRCRRIVPGVVLFRREGANASDGGLQAPWLAAFLVGEVPTAGVHREALAQAVRLLPRASCNPIRYLGPAFSGSASSFRDVLSMPSLTCADGAPIGGIQFLSGSVSSESVQSTLTMKEPVWTFQSTRPTTVAVQNALYAYLTENRQVASDSGVLRGVAMLVESGTTFGRSVSGAGIAAGVGASPRPESYLEFPPLHHDAQAPAAAPREGAVTARNPFPRRDIEPALSSATDEGHDALLDTFFEQIIHNRIRFVGIVSSDPQDIMYLARRIHGANADVRVFAFGTDVMYLDPTQARDMYGALVVSAYLFPGDGEYGPDPNRVHKHVPIAGQLYAGVFNAALGLVRPEKFDKQAVGYIATDGGLFLPIWVAAVANDEYIPLDVAVSETDGARTGRLPFVFGQTVTRAPAGLADLHEPEPKLWYALLAAASLGSGLLVYAFCRSRAKHLLLCFNYTLRRFARSNREPASISLGSSPQPPEAETQQRPAIRPAESLFTRRCENHDHILEQDMMGFLLFSYLTLFLGGLASVAWMSVAGPSSRASSDSSDAASFAIGSTMLFLMVSIATAATATVSGWLGCQVFQGICGRKIRGNDMRAPGWAPILGVLNLLVLYVLAAYSPLIVLLVVAVALLGLFSYWIWRRKREGASEWFQRIYYAGLFSLQGAFLICVAADFTLSLRTAKAFDPVMTALVYQRWTDLGGGACPVLPSLFGCGLITVFSLGQLASLRTLDTLEHLAFKASKCLADCARESRNPSAKRLVEESPLAFVFGMDPFAGSIQESEESVLVLARWYRRPPDIMVAAILGAGVLLLLLSEIRVEPLATLEGRGGDLVFQLTFLVGVTIIAFALLVFLSFSRSLLLLLRALRTHPLAPAYKRVPDPWDKPLDRRLFGPPLDCSEVRMLLPVLDRVVALLDKPDAGGSAATPLATTAETRLVAAKVIALFNQASKAEKSKPDDVLAPIVAAARILYRERRRDAPSTSHPVAEPRKNTQDVAFAESPPTQRASVHAPVQNAIAPERAAEKRESSAEADVIVARAGVVVAESGALTAQVEMVVARTPETGPHEQGEGSTEEVLSGSKHARPSRPPPDGPEGKLWRKFDYRVDVLVASVVSVVISQLLAQYRYLVFVVVGCTMLLSLKLTSYPFAPHGFLTEFLWVGTLVVAVATFAVYAVLRRDPLLALIGQYKGGSLSYNIDLVKWFLTWIAVPTLSAAAVRYPALFASLANWIGPLTRP